jgi:hypothetical protein
MTAKLDLNTLSHVRQMLATEMEHQVLRHDAHLTEYRHDADEGTKNSWREKRAKINGQMLELASQMHNLTKLIQVNQ